MSLVSFGLRLAVSRLLAGRTWAEDRIHNSPMDPVADVLCQDNNGLIDQRPLIAVFTNDEKGTNEGRDIGGRPGSLDLIFFIYMPPTTMVAEDGEIKLETRDAGGAMALDLVWHQCRAALVLGPQAWRAVYEAFVAKITDVRARPILIETEKGVRVPAKEVIVTMDVVPEPDIGKPLSPYWQKLDTAMRADAAAAPLADIVKAMIEEPANLASWQLERANLTVSDAAIRSLGIAPIDPTETTDGPDLDQADLIGDIETVGPDAVP